MKNIGIVLFGLLSIGTAYASNFHWPSYGKVKVYESKTRHGVEAETEYNLIWSSTNDEMRFTSPKSGQLDVITDKHGYFLRAEGHENALERFKSVAPAHVLGNRNFAESLKGEEFRQGLSEISRERWNHWVELWSYIAIKEGKVVSYMPASFGKYRLLGQEKNGNKMYHRIRYLKDFNKEEISAVYNMVKDPADEPLNLRIVKEVEALIDIKTLMPLEVTVQLSVEKDKTANTKDHSSFKLSSYRFDW